MRHALIFSLGPDPEVELQSLERLKEIFDLINMDKEEQVIDPDFFTGNLADYPLWLRAAFQNRELKRELEDFSELDPGELKNWEIEEWYEELAACDAFKYSVRPGDSQGRHVLEFEADDRHYGGDQAHGWVLLAAGAFGLEEYALGQESAKIMPAEESMDPEELLDMHDGLEDNTDARPEF